MKVRILIVLLFFMVISKAHAYNPETDYHITDFTGILSDQERCEIGRELKVFEDETGNGIFVLITRSQEDENLWVSADNVFDRWEVGSNYKKGAVFVYDIRTQELKIDVTPGIEKAFTKDVKNYLNKKIIIPKTEQGRYVKGLKEALAMMKALMEQGFILREPDFAIKSRIDVLPAIIFILCATLLTIRRKAIVSKEKARPED